MWVLVLPNLESAFCIEIYQFGHHYFSLLDSLWPILLMTQQEVLRFRYKAEVHAYCDITEKYELKKH